MNLVKSSIAGTAYGVRFSEDGLAVEKQIAYDIRDQDACFYKRVFWTSWYWEDLACKAITKDSGAVFINDQ